MLDLLVKVLPRGGRRRGRAADRRVDKMTVISTDGAGSLSTLGRVERGAGPAAVRRPDRHRPRGAAAPAQRRRRRDDGVTRVPITSDGDGAEGNGAPA